MALKKGDEIKAADINNSFGLLKNPHVHKYSDQHRGSGWEDQAIITEMRDTNPNSPTKINNVTAGTTMVSAQLAAELDKALEHYMNHTHTYLDKYGTACNCNCTAGEYLVLMGDGSFKRMDQIVNGDVVVSLNLSTLEHEPKVVSNWFMKLVNEVMLVRTQAGSIIATPEHKLFENTTFNYVETKDLVVKHKLRRYDHSDIGISKNPILISQERYVYDFEVADNHNFYFKVDEDSDLILSSNCRCNCTRGGI